MQRFNIKNSLTAKESSPGQWLLPLCETINFEHAKADHFSAPSL